MKFLSNIDIDASFKPIGGELPCTIKKTITFDGGTTGAIGDEGGALDPFDIFVVTGLIKCSLVGICTTDLVSGGGGTLEVGIAGNTAILGAQITATALDALELHLGDTTPATSFIVGEENAAADNLPIYLLNGTDIIGTVGTADITAGVIDYYLYWRPMSSDALVTAA